MAAMIIYNGVDLEDVAPVMIEDIRVGPIEYNPVSRPRAIVSGSEFVRMRKGNRTVSVTFALLTESRDERQAQLASISQWAKTNQEYKLQLPHYNDRYLMAVCTGKPEPSYRQWWESKLRLVFSCFNEPHWLASEEGRVPCGTMFTTEGDAPPLMRIEASRTSAATLQRYSNGIETMEFRTVPAGNMMIDLNRQLATVGGSSIMDQYQSTSRFLIPRAGTQTISGYGYVYYRARWE